MSHKAEAFSPHDRAGIIEHLRQGSGSWSGTRSGHQVRIVRYRLADRPGLFSSTSTGVIEFAVQIKRTWISGKAGTVADALEEINRLIAADQRHKEAVKHSTQGGLYEPPTAANH